MGVDGIDDATQPARVLPFDLLRIIFDYCFSSSKVRLASACKDLFDKFKDDLKVVNNDRVAMIFDLQTRARVMAYDRGCYNHFGGQTSRDVWKVVMRRMGVNPKFCTTEHECITRITQVLNKKTPDDLNEMLRKFRTFNMIFHQILQEAATLHDTFNALYTSHEPTGTQRTDRVIMFADLCMDAPASSLQVLLENQTIHSLLKECMEVTNNPMILMQFMRFPDEDLRYWCDVALKNIANS